MVLPKRKTSIMRRNRRHGTWERLTLKKLTKVTNITKCKNCGADVLSHRVCKACGFYAGEQILTIKTKSKEKILEA